MSAYVVTPAHIATCAKIIREIIFHFDKNPPSDSDVRMDLAMANVISVTFRYGPEGRRAYASIFSSILGQLDDAGWDTSGVDHPEGVSDINAACFEEGYTVSDYLRDCRSAEPRRYSHAEACEYLSCLNYQSCEPPNWPDSKVRMWILESKSYLASRLAKQVLGDRHVWEVRDADPDLKPVSSLIPAQQ